MILLTAMEEPLRNARRNWLITSLRSSITDGLRPTLGSIEETLLVLSNVGST